MKKIKKLSLTLIIVIVLGVSFGCSQEKEPESQISVSTNVGFVSELSPEYGEDGRNYVDFAFDGGSLKLEVENLDVFNEIEEDEFYRFAYDKNNILLSLDKDNYLKELVLKSMEEGIEPSQGKHISPSEKISTEGLALLDSYEYDINGDGVEEIIAMYVNAEQGPDGEVYWDDGQDWLFIVKGQEEDYVLFNDYVQLGDIRFHIYTVDEDFYITTIQSGTANLDIMEYKFNPDSKEFVSTLKHATTGNVNMLHSAYGY